MRKQKVSRNIITILTACLLIIYLSPLYLLFTIALKTNEDFSKNNFGLPKHIMWQNLIDAMKDMDYFKSFLSSLVIAVGAIFLILILASMASYALARRSKRIYSFLYIFFLSGMMIPFQLTMLPLYKFINTIHLMGTHLGVILLYVASYLPIAIVILTGFMKTIPRDLDEAAAIDGASPFYIFLHIILPLVKPPLTTVMIFSVVGIWNDLLTPMLFLGSKSPTLIVNLYNFVGAFYRTNWTMVFAGSIVTMLPLLILFLVCQRYFIEGMVAGAVKG
jgi:raffinose/stachyose/melibiose transport system permease protein